MTNEEQVTTVPDEQQLDEVRDQIQEQIRAGDASTAVDQLEPINDADQAQVLLELDDEERGPLLAEMTAKRIAGMLDHVDAEDAIKIARLLPTEKLASVLDEAPPNIAADIVRGTDWKIARQALARMSNRRAVGSLLLYADDDAGGIMTPEVVGLRDTLSASQALNSLRLSDYQPGQLSQVFVIDGERKLIGYLGLPEIVFAAPFARLRDIMHEDVISVRTGTDQEECARLMRRYDLTSLPVVDEQNQLQGAISLADVLEVAVEEATEDMFKMSGTSAEDRATGPVLTSIKTRLPWLLANIGTVIVVAAILSLFEPTLDRLAVLAVYMPMVMNQAGIAGTQVVTVIVRSLALEQISTADTRGLLVRESLLALANGTIVAIVLGLVVAAWRVDLILGAVVGGSTIVSYFVAAASGVLIPVTMKKLKIDPATASGVVLTTFTDIAGGATYLALATMVLSQLRGAG